MKTIIIILSFLILVASTCFGQEEKKSKYVVMQVDAGTCLGLFTSLEGTEKSKTTNTPKPGLYFGFNINVKCAKYFYIQSGICLSQHRALITYDNSAILNSTSYISETTYYQKEDIKYSYLQFPFLMRFGQQTGLYGNFGFAATYNFKTIDKWERKQVKSEFGIKTISEYSGTNDATLQYGEPKIDLFSGAIMARVGYVFKFNLGLFTGMEMDLGTLKSTELYDYSKTYGPSFSFNDIGWSIGASYSF